MTKKKYFMIGVLALSIATLSGCVGEVKTLECTKTSDSEGMKMNELIKAEFNGNKVTNIDMNISFDITGQQDGFAKTLEDSLKKSFDEEYGDKKGVDYKVNTTSKEVGVSIKMELDKMTDADKKELNVEGGYDTYDDSKKDLEKEGYTCK